jgi:toxin YoeB
LAGRPAPGRIICIGRGPTCACVDPINSLIDDIQRHPFTGLDKPEPLNRNLRGFWSRSTTREQRLVYRIETGVLQIAQCRFQC